MQVSRVQVSRVQVPPLRKHRVCKCRIFVRSLYGAKRGVLFTSLLHILARVLACALVHILARVFAFVLAHALVQEVSLKRIATKAHSKKGMSLIFSAVPQVFSAWRIEFFCLLLNCHKFTKRGNS